MDHIFIGISGPSGSGKSLFSNSIAKKFSLNAQISLLREDSYYKHCPDLTLEERHNKNYDHPDAFDHDLLIDHLIQLKRGLSVDVPKYDYATHLRKKETQCVAPCAVVILEGILLLSDIKLRALLDLKIYLDVPLDICLLRRMHRDAVERGRNMDVIIRQYRNHVRPMFHEFIEPSKDHADIIIPQGGKNIPAIDLIQEKIEKFLINA